MAWNPLTTLQVVTSHLKVGGRYDHVQIGEPKEPPTGQLTACVIMSGVRTPETVLDAPVRVYDLLVRLYMSMLDPGTDTETRMARTVGETLEDFEGDFTLGGNVRAVDFGGVYGASVEARWGYVEVGGKMYRMCDISVPLIVDPAAATFVA